MPGNIADLTTEFNATAQTYLLGKIPAQLVATKYAVLAKHCAETDAERKVLAGAHFNCVVRWLGNLSNNDGDKPDSSSPGTLKILLGGFDDTKHLHLLPENAAAQMAESALGVLRRAENGKLDRYDRDGAISLAGLALEFADRLAALRAGSIPAEAPAAPKKKDESLNL